MREIPRGKKGAYKLFLKEIEAIRESGRTSSILLHSCCAPCSSSVVEQLKPYFRITIFYYNPNIHPKKEYIIRKEENQWFAREIMKIRFIEGEYDPRAWFEAVRGLEKEPEGGRRCPVCYRFRLEKTAQVAKELGFDYFTTTLSVSPHKNVQWINEIGLQLEEQYGVRFLVADFKKGGGYQRSLELSRQYDLYRQHYCGCVFSLRDRRQHEREKRRDSEDQRVSRQG